MSSIDQAGNSLTQAQDLGLEPGLENQEVQAGFARELLHSVTDKVLQFFKKSFTSVVSTLETSLLFILLIVFTICCDYFVGM